MWVKKYFGLFLTGIKVRGWEFCLALRGIKNWRIRFILSEFINFLLYLRCSPYRISRKFHQQRGDKEIYCYGETPLITLRKIANAVQLSSKDTILDAGSGTGRNAFWFYSYVGCKALSIEQIGEFVIKSRLIAKMLFCSMSVRFFFGDLLNCAWGTPSIVYLYNFMLEDEQLKQFADRCAQLKRGTRIVTVSVSLMDYDTDSFEFVESFKGSFSWGETDIYVLIVK